MLNGIIMILYSMGLKLYYYVSEGKKNEINLRDVWVGPTSQLSKPPLHCNNTFVKNKWWFFCCFFFYGVLNLCWMFERCVTNPQRNFFDQTELDSDLLILKVNSMCGSWTALLILWDVNLFSGYPSERCNNDDELIVLFVLHLGWFIVWMLNRPCFICQIIYRIIYRKCFQSRRITREPSRGTIDTKTYYSRVNNLNIIKIATDNLNLKKKQVPFEKIHVYLSDDGPIRECPICVESYLPFSKSPLIMECGHI
mmetsp:Transcript_35772/g.46098  ORF Transcript_35772/g.46098 Transcript_35772/m.46098 type:complete len:253 (-) Transcript_35772:230-988(-)